MTSTATASAVAYLGTAQERLQSVYGSASLSTLETVIVQATRLHPALPKYELEVEIEGIGDPAYETKLKIFESTTTRSADWFLAQFYDLGDVQTEKDLAGKPVTAFYDGTRLVGLQRRY